MRLLLSDGGHTLVDDDVYELVNKWKWRKNSQGYVRRSLPNGEFLHRYITNAPKGKLVDHINRNPLDNTKKNLRICTPSGNNVNMKVRKDSKSGVRGVCLHRASGKWSVEIKYNRNRYFIGLFSRIEEAIGARFTAELEYFGEFCNE